jgi:hypothetical protein
MDLPGGKVVGFTKNEVQGRYAICTMAGDEQNRATEGKSQMIEADFDLKPTNP